MVLKGIFVRTLQKMDSVENTLQLASNSVFDKNKLIVLPLRTFPIHLTPWRGQPIDGICLI